MEKKLLYYTNTGYSYLKCDVHDCYKWGGFGICDSCGKEMKDRVYLIYILHQAFCPDCFSEWIENSTRYEDDLELQKVNHIKWYNAYGFEIINDFKEGELVAYVGKTPEKEIYSIEIGKIKRLCNDGAFVYYHTGETAAKTKYEDLYKIKNLYVLKEIGVKLGGKNDVEENNYTRNS